MKKSIAIVMVLIFALLFTACSSTPEAAVKAFLDDVKKGDGLSVLETLSGEDVLSDVSVGDESITEDDSPEAVLLAQTLIAKMKDFDYEIVGFKENEDGTIDVIVDMTTYNIGGILGAVIVEAFGEALASAFSGNDNTDEFNKHIHHQWRMPSIWVMTMSLFLVHRPTEQHSPYQNTLNISCRLHQIVFPFLQRSLFSFS